MENLLVGLMKPTFKKNQKTFTILYISKGINQDKVNESPTLTQHLSIQI